MKKTTRKKLVLNRETVRSLQDDVLGAVAGGCGATRLCTLISMCICPADNDCTELPV